MNIRISKLDGQTIVIDIEKGDTGEIVDALEQRGHGYAVFGDNVDMPFAVIDNRILDDPNFTQDHLTAIEAHELGHIHQMTKDEPTAELAAIRMLARLGEEGAEALLRGRGIVQV